MKPRRGLPRFFQREILPLDWPGAAPRFECGSCDRTVRAGVVRCWRCRAKRWAKREWERMLIEWFES